MIKTECPDHCKESSVVQKNKRKYNTLQIDRKKQKGYRRIYNVGFWRSFGKLGRGGIAEVWICQANCYRWVGYLQIFKEGVTSKSKRSSFMPAWTAAPQETADKVVPILLSKSSPPSECLHQLVGHFKDTHCPGNIKSSSSEIKIRILHSPSCREIHTVNASRFVDMTGKNRNAVIIRVGLQN